MALRIPDASAEMILAAAEGVYYNRPNFDLRKVANYMRSTDQTAQEALAGAALLGFLRETNPNTYEPEIEILELETHSDNVGRRVLFRSRLEAFPPFRLFKERIFCGDSSLEAAEKVKLLASIENEFPKLKETFQQWGLYAKSFSQDAIGKLACSSEEGLVPAYLQSVDTSLVSIEQARVFLRRRLSEDIFQRLPIEAVDGLSSALARCRARHEDKREIVFAIGSAVEKVLSDIGTRATPPVDLSTARGLVQMSDRLRQADVITGKHVGLFQAIGALRNAADHAVDNEINMAWSLTYESVLDVGLLTIDTIRSLFEWTSRRSATI